MEMSSQLCCFYSWHSDMYILLEYCQWIKTKISCKCSILIWITVLLLCHFCYTMLWRIQKATWLQRHLRHLNDQAFFIDVLHNTPYPSKIPYVIMALAFFTNLLFSAINRHALVKKFRIKYWLTCWFSPKLWALFKERNQA